MGARVRKGEGWGGAGGLRLAREWGGGGHEGRRGAKGCLGSGACQGVLHAACAAPTRAVRTACARMQPSATAPLRML